MKKLKTSRIISLMLALLLLMIAFVSCGNKASNGGKSAYELAVEAGFTGTLEEWLESLKVEGKSAYELAVENGFEGTLEEWLESLRVEGKSAYELAVEAGFTGTLEEWLESLEGKSSEDMDAEKLTELLTLKHELRVDENGDFKVLYIGDVQCRGEHVNDETKNNIKILVDREDPDLVLFIGDNHYTGKVTAAGFKTYLTDMVGYIEEKQIPWAHIYGNHDYETQLVNSSNYSQYLPKEEQQKIYESFEYCVSKAGDEDLFGVGNYVLPVMSHDGSRIEFAIYGLDSGSYRAQPLNSIFNTADGYTNEFPGKYEGIQTNQVRWYRETSELLAEFNGSKVPSMMYFHIPLQEMYTAWVNRDAWGLEYTGERRENISAPGFNAGLFDAVQERGDVQVIVNAHCHRNDFAIEYQGVKMCYNGCTGTGAYHDDDMLGGRVVTYTGNRADAFETRMSYITERPFENVLFDLEIDADSQTAVNGIAGKPAIETNTADGSSIVFGNDESIERDIVTFSPAAEGAVTAAYNIPSHTLNNTLEDGFAYEIYFKLTDAVTYTYAGILNYQEDGGFGLNAYPISGSTDTVTLCAEIDNGESRKIEKVININEWYHCVYTYNGKDKAALYLNGALVGELTLSVPMNVPNFKKGTPHISLGACADGGAIAKAGFAGSIADCRIYGIAVSQEHVWEMFAKLTDAPILELNINANANTVTNGVAGGVSVEKFTASGSGVTVDTDESIGRDVLVFSPSASGATTAYNLPTASLNANFADGFSYEVYFKPTAALTSNYAGILNYQEDGGFGLNLYKDGTSTTTVKLSAELDNGSSRKIEKVIDLNEWCHVVFSYNGSDKVQLYVNGVLAGELELAVGMRTPTFKNLDPHLSIGACAGGMTDAASEGFSGSIAICNIYSVPTDAAGALALYDTATK